MNDGTLFLLINGAGVIAIFSGVMLIQKMTHRIWELTQEMQEPSYWEKRAQSYRLDKERYYKENETGSRNKRRARRLFHWSRWLWWTKR